MIELGPYIIKQNLLNEQRDLCQYPQSRNFYRCIQLKLAEIFLAIKSMASGKIKPSNDSCFLQKIIKSVGRTIELPGVSLVTNLLAGGIGFFKNRQAQKCTESLSACFLNLSDIEIITESVSRALTQRYFNQLLKLEPEGAEHLGICVVARIMNYLYNHSALLAQGADIEQSKDVLVPPLLSSLYKVQMKQGFLKLSNLAIPTKKGEAEWPEAGILTEPGIQCNNEETEKTIYYSGCIKVRLNTDPNSTVDFEIQTYPEIYGYRHGTREEAERLGLIGSFHRVPSEIEQKMQNKTDQILKKNVFLTKQDELMTSLIRHRKQSSTDLSSQSFQLGHRPSLP